MTRNWRSYYTNPFAGFDHCYATPVERPRQREDPPDEYSRLAEVEKEHRTTVETLQRRYEAATAVHEREHSRHLEMIDSQQERIRSLEAALNTLNDEVAQLRASNRQHDLKDQSSETHIESLERQIRNLRAELEASQLKAQSSAQRLIDVVQELQECQKRLDSQMKTNQLLEKELVSKSLSCTNVAAAKPYEELRRSLERGTPSSVSVASSEASENAQQPLHFPIAKETPRMGKPSLALARVESDFQLAEKLESELLAKSQRRDTVESTLRKLENQRVRTVVDKTKRDALAGELASLNYEISEIRKRLRSMQQLFK
jgi:predicted  nucleic acid-binding Zn-ribbon protein